MEDFIQVKDGGELVALSTPSGKMVAVKGSAGEEVPVLPLNGYRGRNLAELLFGVRNDGVWELGVSKLVQVKTLLELPAWDLPNYNYLCGFSGVVCIEVVCVNRSYGAYITVTQMGDHAGVGYAAQQQMMISKHLSALGLKASPEAVASAAEHLYA